MSPRAFAFWISTIAFLLVTGLAFADPDPADTSSHGQSKSRSFLERFLGVVDEGWGGSAISNIGAFYANGDYSFFSAGVGFGVSRKFHSLHHGYKHEFGFYAAPQLQGTAKSTAASVSALVNWNFVQAFGIGVGVRFWENGVGLVRPVRRRTFFTVG